MVIDKSGNVGIGKDTPAYKLDINGAINATSVLVNGVAVGAGLDMALMCDLRIASRSARLSEGYVKVGLTPGDGGAYYLPRLVGTSKALELLLTGDFVTADEAGMFTSM